MIEVKMKNHKAFTVTYYISKDQEQRLNSILKEMRKTGTAYKSTGFLFNAVMNYNSDNEIENRIRMTELEYGIKEDPIKAR